MPCPSGFTSIAMKMAGSRESAPIRLTDDKFYLTLVMAAVALTSVLAVALALLLHRNFLTIACDTADLQCAIVNTLHGHFLEKNGAGGPSLLASHTTFLLLAVIPAYLVAPSADTLFILQVIGVYATAVPIYLLGLEILEVPVMAMVIALSAIVSPLLIDMAMAPFHLETWIAGALFWALLFYRRGNVAGYITALIVAVCCAEQAAMILLGLGASLLLVGDGRAWRRKCGVIALALGVAWLALDLILVRSLSRNVPGGFNIFAYNYASFGVHSAAELPGAVLGHPGLTLGLLLNGLRWEHLFLVVGLPLLFAFFSWRSLLLLAPAPAYLLMSDQEFYLYFHAYYFTFAFVAGYLGLLYFLAGRPPLGRTSVTVLAFTLLSNLLLLVPATGYYFRLAGGADPDFTPVVHAQLDRIPVSAGVYTAHRFSAYLSNRQDMVIGDLRTPDLDFDAMMEDRFAETNVHARDIDFIVSDFYTDQCGWRNGYLDNDQFQARSNNVDRLVASGKWSLAFKQDGFVILERVP